MRGLASFASSDSGKAFARTERYWGRDPAATLEPLDDVLAYNLRAAFMVALGESEPKPESDHAAQVEKTRTAGEEIRSRIG